MTERQQEIYDVVQGIRPLLAGHMPDVQGAALADLTAIWLAGHPPSVRSEMLAHQVRFIMRLTTVNDHIMFGEAGHPSQAERN